jgi:hypothetical protein
VDIVDVEGDRTDLFIGDDRKAHLSLNPRPRAWRLEMQNGCFRAYGTNHRDQQGYRCEN